MRNFIGVLIVASALAFGASVQAQAPAASGEVPVAMNPADLDTLVGPIALYPDDLIAIILPASTYPVEVVQADRFLDRRKTQKDLPVNEAWQDPVKALLNYPEIVKKMSADLDWTVALGEAVVADQSAVLQAVQRFRRQTQSVGNLKTDDKQTVVVEKEVIRIVPSNPEVIYVPQYNPSTVIVSSPTPVYTYAPAPYPVYYYPYAPGAAFATGLIWGAAITAAWHGGHYETHYSGGNNTININRESNVNRTEVRNELSNRAANRSGTGTQQSSTWRSEKQPGQVSGTGARASTPRVGDAPSRAGSGSPGASGGTERAAARTPTGTQNAARAQNTGNYQGQGRGGDAFSGYGSAQAARADSARGAASRQSMSGGQGGRGFQGGGGGGFQGGGGFSGGGRGGFGGGGGRAGRR
ncbi:hypothetical protein AWB78_00594 [Caballeronia calidae]|uniref:DUF3300 domain-containing protein n=1 Tax=Caballeronia calidae TaxID=1777139 RepID=A0A157ZIB5_9BURK|nr:DUF3300 domain-containing protein [Caballeronia calidae]SAK45226.1 hypothetical protein AWB78_00594 [Caballeronia calidae]